VYNYPARVLGFSFFPFFELLLFVILWKLYDNCVNKIKTKFFVVVGAECWWWWCRDGTKFCQKNIKN